MLLGLLTFVLIAVFAGLWWWSWAAGAVNPSVTEPQTVVIPSASGAIAIGNLLEEKGLIRNGLRFRLYVQSQGWDKDLKPGRYQLAPSLTMPQIAEKLKAGVLEDFWVTIPEGKRREEVALILANTFAENKLAFSIPDFLESTQDLEGYLFPDTYLLPRTSTADTVADQLKATFDKKIPADLATKAQALELIPKQIIILASLVEREAKFEKDRPMIAGVLINRIREGMALQIDATVQYPVGTARCQASIGKECDWWPVISDTTYNSPYNTYQNPGLPPAPICNPGLSVIESVLNPNEHNYLYYLSEDDGTTHYSETLAEHEEKIEQYLK